MSTNQSTVDFIVDQLVSLKNIRTRKMFGEYYKGGYPYDGAKAAMQNKKCSASVARRAFL